MKEEKIYEFEFILSVGVTIAIALFLRSHTFVVEPAKLLF